MSVVLVSELDEEARRLHEGYMREALKVADAAFEQGEVAVGCIFVYKGKVVASGGNLTNADNDATRHAELVAFDRLMKEYTNWKEIVKEMVLYVTCEPCIMCASAIRMMGVRLVVYGCRNSRFGGCGSVMSLHAPDVMPKLTPYDCVAGVLEQEAIDALQRFYGRANPKTTPAPE